MPSYFGFYTSKDGSREYHRIERIAKSYKRQAQSAFSYEEKIELFQKSANAWLHAANLRDDVSYTFFYYTSDLPHYKAFLFCKRKEYQCNKLAAFYRQQL